MALIKKTFKSLDELIGHIKTHTPSFYFSSQTSTVIPYDYLEEIFTEKDFALCDLTNLPRNLEMIDSHTLKITGPISWQDAKDFLAPKGLTIKTAPTEELALISAGAATSATGERYFHFGNLRSQIKSIDYINYKGELIRLNKEKPFPLELASYKLATEKYKNFKNPPFPVFENETDLLIGTEGQLGVITSLELEVTDDIPVNHLFMLIPQWEKDRSIHLQIIDKIQKFRGHSHICEFIDHNSFTFLKEQDRPNKGKDAIFFEVKSDHFEDFYENFLMELENIDHNEIFELSAKRFHEIRASIPRAVYEENSRMGVKKMGTDVQVRIEDFLKLMDVYENFSKMGVRYNLFGHFGDAHLHFNFMPDIEDTPKCQKAFEQMYHQVLALGGSPFAEHGIGIIKQKFIKEFWTSAQKETFLELKKLHDPHNQFFPQGFMSLS